MSLIAEFNLFYSSLLLVLGHFITPPPLLFVLTVSFGIHMCNSPVAGSLSLLFPVTIYHYKIILISRHYTKRLICN